MGPSLFLKDLQVSFLVYLQFFCWVNPKNSSSFSKEMLPHFSKASLSTMYFSYVNQGFDFLCVFEEEAVVLAIKDSKFLLFILSETWFRTAFLCYFVFLLFYLSARLTWFLNLNAWICRISLVFGLFRSFYQKIQYHLLENFQFPFILVFGLVLFCQDLKSFFGLQPIIAILPQACWTQCASDLLQLSPLLESICECSFCFSLPLLLPAVVSCTLLLFQQQLVLEIWALEPRQLLFLQFSNLLSLQVFSVQESQLQLPDQPMPMHHYRNLCLHLGQTLVSLLLLLKLEWFRVCPRHRIDLSLVMPSSVLDLFSSSLAFITVLHLLVRFALLTWIVALRLV